MDTDVVRTRALGPEPPGEPEVPPPHRDPPEHEPITPIFPDLPSPEDPTPETQPDPV